MGRKHDNLMRWVVGGQGFVSAYHSVLRHKGAAGVDGVKTEDLPPYLLHHWERIKTELLAGEYQPQLIRGVPIPKSNGGIRQLGIPTVMDRLVQQAIHQVLSPINCGQLVEVLLQNQYLHNPGIDKAVQPIMHAVFG